LVNPINSTITNRLHAGGHRAAGAHIRHLRRRAAVRSALIDDRADLDSSALLEAGTAFG
jgi:hypothetical protein